MKKNTFILILCCLVSQLSMAQAPKWFDKSKRAVFSLITYDKDGKILNNGNGFFISENGVALSDYSAFKGAERAVVVDVDGKQMPVDAILGAHSMYDIIKFRVETGGKKVTALPVATVPPAEGAEIYLMGYSPQKDRLFTAGAVKEVSTIEKDYQYYTLTLKLTGKTESCPVLTADGKVFGISQPASGKDTETLCYAAGASYGASLSITALGMADFTLNTIGIRKGLPDTEEQALVFLFMASSMVTADEYEALLNEFIKEYPNSVDGYTRRAGFYVFNKQDPSYMDKASDDYSKALSVASKKDDIHYNFAKLIYNYQLTGPQNVYKDWTMDKALEEIRKAIAIDPMPIYIQTEGDILFGKRDFPAAYASYEKVMGTNMASSSVFYGAAKAKELMGAEVTEIIALMDSCISHCSDPVTVDEAPYFLERAGFYMATEQYRKAIPDYDSYYKGVHGRVNDLFYYYREQACFYAKLFQRALDDIAKAIELNPQEPLYHTELGLINLRVGRNEEAVAALQKTIEINPEYMDAYRLLGICMVQLKRNKEACDYFEKAKQLGDATAGALIEKHCK